MRGRSPIRSIGLANTTGNQEQVAALPRRQRQISVPYRSAATPPPAAQRPQSGVWHQNGGGQPHNRSPLPHAGEASQTSPGGETTAPEGRNPAARRNNLPDSCLARSFKSAHYERKPENRPWRNCSWPACDLQNKSLKNALSAHSGMNIWTKSPKAALKMLGRSFPFFCSAPKPCTGPQWRWGR